MINIFHFLNFEFIKYYINKNRNLIAILQIVTVI